MMGVETILSMSSSLPSRKKHVLNLEASEKLLLKQRFMLLKDWMNVSNVTSIFNDFVTILNRRVQVDAYILHLCIYLLLYLFICLSLSQYPYVSIF